MADLTIGRNTVFTYQIPFRTPHHKPECVEYSLFDSRVIQNCKGESGVRTLKERVSIYMTPQNFVPTPQLIDEARNIGMAYQQLEKDFSLPFCDINLDNHEGWNYSINIRIQGIAYNCIGTVEELLEAADTQCPIILSEDRLSSQLEELFETLVIST